MLSLSKHGVGFFNGLLTPVARQNEGTGGHGGRGGYEHVLDIGDLIHRCPAHLSLIHI